MPIASMNDLRQRYKSANCSADRIKEGGCTCEAFGLGAGMGWRVTVTCGTDVISFEVPPRNDKDGVGFARDLTCEDLADNRSALELFDQARGAFYEPTQSWHWPASFFEDETGQRMDRNPMANNGDWVEHYCYEIFDPKDLMAGDIIWFTGPNPRRPGENISHSAIATGRGDELSHFWLTREIQHQILENGKKNGDFTIPASAPGPHEPNGYEITRDSLSDLLTRFADPKTGKVYYSSHYRHFRIKDDRMANFPEFDSCDD